MPEKKKVYVETTVVSDAMTLPLIQKEIENAGYACPVICIPPALEGGDYVV